MASESIVVVPTTYPRIGRPCVCQFRPKCVAVKPGGYRIGHYARLSLSFLIQGARLFWTRSRVSLVFARLLLCWYWENSGSRRHPDPSGTEVVRITRPGVVPRSIVPGAPE